MQGAPHAQVCTNALQCTCRATGVHPFGTTERERRQRIKAHQPDLSQLSPRTAPELLHLVDAMLQHDPSQRPGIEEVSG